MDIQSYIGVILNFLNQQVIPILVSIGFVFFLWNITRYFIIESGNEESRERARGLAVWGLFALALMVAIWGVVAIFVEALGVGSRNNNAPIPDYIEYRDRGTGVGGSGNLDMPPCIDGVDAC